MRSSRISRALLLGAVVLAACTGGGREEAPPKVTVAGGDVVTAVVAHRDARVASAPSFAWLHVSDDVKFETAQESATISLKSVARSFGLADAALATIRDAQIDDHGKGPILARYKQQIDGVDVFRGDLAIAMRRDFHPVAASGFLARRVEGQRVWARDPRKAIDDALATMLPSGPALAFTEAEHDAGYIHFTSSGLKQPARVKKVLFPSGDDLVPAYYVELQIARGPSWGYVVSATDGHTLLAFDLQRNDAFSYRVFADPTTKIPFDGPQGNAAAPHPTGKPDGSRPTWIAPTLVSLQNFPFSKNDPWLAPDAVTTSGNNVRAYPDIVQPDGPNGDTGPALSGDKAFDWTYDTAASPSATTTNIQGSTTQLFYVTNFLHDWFYDAGFDEKSGNHQSENFGRGGLGRDPLRAEAQDFSGRNNANAQVPPDGSSPILQMFIFSGPSIASLTVNEPASIAGTKAVGLPGFGLDSFDLTGSVVLGIDDTGADPSDACEPLTNNVAGKIVLVHRGLCSFVQKAQTVQAAGGTGVIVANVPSSAQPTVPPFMGGTAGNITIPVLSLALGDGQAMEGAVASGVNVTMHRAPQTDLDGALDNTIVAHEWGHVLSGRLVHDGLGLTTNQSGGLGEGWADFVSLLLTAREDDVATPSGANWAGAYPNGAYATSGQGSDFYFGIRRVPYSADFAKNPLTFKHISNGIPLPGNVPISFGEDGSFNAQVHSTGEVWSTMLWECYVALLRAHPFADAQDRMKRYLVASLKLTPSDPTLLEARDAVLAAAFATDEKDYKLLWEAFGRRGAGVGAEGPPKDSTTNEGVKESFYVGNDVTVTDAQITDDIITCDHDGILDDGEEGTLTFSVRNAGPGLLSAPIAKLSTLAAGVTFLDGNEVKVSSIKPFEVTKVSVRAKVNAPKTIEPITLDVLVSDPSIEGARAQTVKVTTRFGVDEAPDSSAIDHVDTKNTAWVSTGEDEYGTTKPWERVRVGSDARWVVANSNETATQWLTGPEFLVAGSTFELAFKHRHSFRFSTRRNVDIDGGVIEVSTDNGRSWKDLSTFGKVDYNTTLDETRSNNPLRGRRAYGNKSAGYPMQWINSRISVDLGEHPESVRIRFVVGTNQGFSGAPGWEIDDIELLGIASTPFWSFIAHQDLCDENGPTVNAGAGKNVKSREAVTLEGTGTHPAGLPLTFVWTQIEGPPVNLVTDGSPKLKFDAPDLKGAGKLTFQLRAHDGALLSPASRVDVNVTPSSVTTTAEGNGCGCKVPSSGTGSSALGVLGLVPFAALLVRRRRRG